jgi:hypothetical protein
MSPLFTAQDGRVVFDGQPIREITRARIKSALTAMGEKTANVATLNRLGDVWMSLIRASIEANNQNRKAA